MCCSKCAVEATCRAWRDLARAVAAVAAAAVTVTARLDTEERLDSLGLWLFRRAGAVRHLSFEHFQCQRLDPIAANVLETVAASLTSLSLTLSKHYKNRRGLRGPASLSWAPPLPALRRLDLTLAWETEASGWGVPRWAPNLEEFTMRWEDLQLGRSLDQFEGPAAALPPSLTRLALCGAAPGVHDLLQPSWATNLRSMSINWPGWAPGHVVYSVPPAAAATVEAALRRLSALTALAMNVSTFGDGEDGRCGAAAALRAVSSLRGLRTLKLAGVADHAHPVKLHRLEQLETLHLYGGPFWGFEDAPLPALRELALIIVASTDTYDSLAPVRVPHVMEHPGLTRLILNYDGSGTWVGCAAEWAAGWGYEFDPAAQTLEELVVVETRRIAPLGDAAEGPVRRLYVPGAVVAAVVAAGRGGQLRVAVGDDTYWGRECLDPRWDAAVLGLQKGVGAPPAELVAEVAAWGRWRAERGLLE